MSDCKIGKGGRFYTRGGIGEAWVDNTSFAIRFLFDECTLEEGVTLRDVFLLLDSNLDMFDIVLGNWTREFTTEVLHGSSEKSSDLDHLYLEWSLNVDDHWSEDGQKTGRTHVDGNLYPGFHGWGTYHGEGVKGRFGVSLSPASSLADLPLKLVETFSIHNNKAWWESRGSEKEKPWEEFSTVYDHAGFTLGQILQGIIWELSWNGNPTSRDQFREELDRRAGELEEEEVEFHSVVSLESFVMSLREKFDEMRITTESED